MLKIGTPQQIAEYRNSQNLNQSTLKKLIKGPAYFLKEDTEEKSYFNIGSAVDTILFGSKSDFWNNFYTIPEKDKPTDSIKNIIDTVFTELTTGVDNLKFIGTLEQNAFILLKVADDLNYQPNYKPETKVKTLIEKGSKYFQQLFHAHGKTILTYEEETTIFKVVHSLQQHHATKDYFDLEQLEKSKDFTVYIQYPLYFKYAGLNCKALPDMFIVRKINNSYHIELIDLKTTSGDTVNFLYSIRKYRYDIQLAWYHLAILLSPSIPEEELQKDKVAGMNYQFIVESTTNTGNPAIYKLDDTIIQNAIESTNKSIKSIEDLLSDLEYYNNHGYNTNRILDENNHIIQVGINDLYDEF
jgi:hypothetical protein